MIWTLIGPTSLKVIRSVRKHPAYSLIYIYELPENELYPKGLEKLASDIMSVCAYADTSIIQTHSPHFLDFFSVESVIFCAAADAFYLFSENEEVQAQVGIFTTGEIWMSLPDESFTTGQKYTSLLEIIK